MILMETKVKIVCVFATFCVWASIFTNNLLLQWTQQGLKNVQEKSKKSPVEQIAMAIFFTKICNNKKLWKMYLLERLHFLYVLKTLFLKEKYFRAFTNTLGKSKKNFGTKIFFLGREKNLRINVLFEPCHPVPPVVQ